MKYISNTVWKHSNPIKWGKKQEAMDQFNREGNVEEVFWFAIDENTHRAVNVFPSEEVIQIKQKWNNMRNEASSNMNNSMTYEAYGPARVTKTGS